MSKAWPAVTDVPFEFSSTETGRGGSLVCFEGHAYPAIEIDEWGERLMPAADGAVVAFTVVAESGCHIRVMAQATSSRHAHKGRWERFVEIVAQPHPFPDEDDWRTLPTHRDLLDDPATPRGYASVACFDDRDETCLCESCQQLSDELGDLGRAGMPLGVQVRRWVQRFAALSPDGWIEAPAAR